MRPIKFRAWDKKNNKICSVWDISWKAWHDDELNYIRVECGNGTYDLFEHEIELMQFTGLHDKNGKEIYESYIISWPAMNWTHAEIKFGSYVDDNGYGHYGYYAQQGNEIMHFDGDSELEIIGNIYENPELLK